MENDNLSWLKSDLERLYLRYILRRSKEIVENKITGRLVIDFQKGILNTVHDQQILSGASIVNFGLSKLD